MFVSLIKPSSGTFVDGHVLNLMTMKDRAVGPNITYKSSASTTQDGWIYSAYAQVGGYNSSTIYGATNMIIGGTGGLGCGCALPITYFKGPTTYGYWYTPGNY